MNLDQVTHNISADNFIKSESSSSSFLKKNKPEIERERPPSPVKVTKTLAPTSPSSPRGGSLTQIESEKVSLQIKITSYLNHKTYGPMIPKSIVAPKGTESLEQLEMILTHIRCAVSQGCKKPICMGIMGGMLNAAEFGLVQAGRMEKVGVANHIMSNTEQLQPELDQVIIEAPDWIIPSPYAALAMSLGRKIMDFDNGKFAGAGAAPDSGSSVVPEKLVVPSSKKFPKKN